MKAGGLLDLKINIKSRHTGLESLGNIKQQISHFIEFTKLFVVDYLS